MDSKFYSFDFSDKDKLGIESWEIDGEYTFLLADAKSISMYLPSCQVILTRRRPSGSRTLDRASS